MKNLQRSCNRFSCHSGFTLLNLIVGFSLLSILMGAGVPSLGKLYANHRADSAYDELFTLIQFTRSQAVSHRTQVLLCPSKNNKNCVKDWTLPLMIFVDKDLDEKRDKDETILREVAALQGHEKIFWKGSGSKRYLRFKHNGGTGNQNGRITFCHTQGKELSARQIIIHSTGRIRRGETSKATRYC